MIKGMIYEHWSYRDGVTSSIVLQAEVGGMSGILSIHLEDGYITIQMNNRKFYHVPMGQVKRFW